MKLPIFTLAGTLGLLLCGAALPIRAWGAVEESFFLPNGLKVILVAQPDNPVVSMRVMIRTGSADESTRSEYGLAHLMEHMAFKGSVRYPEPGLISKMVERNGGSMNAYTSHDSTVYYFSLPAEQVAMGLDVLAELVFHPLYDPKEYELEKEVVIEEIKRGRDNPDRTVMETFFNAAYPDHPYGRPVIGYEETVKAATVKEAKAFHELHYRPDNAVLVVTGGFDSAVVKESIEKFYASLPKAKDELKAKPTPALATPKGPEIRLAESEKVALAKVFMGFRSPAAYEPGAATMDLLSAVLSGGKASRLVEVVKDEKQLVTDISSAAYTPRHQGTFMISFETEPSKVTAATKAVLEELEKLVTSPPADEELSRARSLAEKSFLAGQESAMGLGSQITEFENLFGDWRLRDAYLPLWQRTGSEELAKKAAEHFLPKNLTISVLLPPEIEGDGRPTPEQLAKVATDLMPAVQEIEAEKQFFREMALDNGIKLLVRRDASLPLVNVRAAALGGLLADPAEEEGLNNFMASVWSKATLQKNAAELSRAVEGLGATLSAFSGRNSLGLVGSFLASQSEPGLELFAEVLMSPKFSKEDVERVRPEILAQIKAQEEQLGRRVMRSLATKLYPGDHPYSRDQLGTEESVTKITPADLKASYENIVRPENLIITVAGDVEPGKVRETLNSLIGKWKPAGESVKVSVPAAPPAITEPTKTVETIERAQTHLALGFQAAALGTEDVPALEVLAAYLGGMSGPLFRELRDQQSLAYTVQCSYNPGLNVSSFVFYIATAPEKVDEALSGFAGIIDRVRQKPISAEELEGAKRYIIGVTKIGLQTVASRAAQATFNTLYGLGIDYDQKRLAAIEKVTASDLQKAAAKYLAPEREVLAILGNVENIENAKSAESAK